MGEGGLISYHKQQGVIWPEVVEECPHTVERKTMPQMTV